MMTGTARKNSTTSHPIDAHRLVVGELGDAEDEAEDEGAEDGQHGHRDGVEPRLTDRLHDVGRDERLPELVLELTRVVEPLDGVGEHRHQEDRGDDRVDAVPGHRLGPRCIEEHSSSHYAILQRRSKVPATSETSSTSTM